MGGKTRNDGRRQVLFGKYDVNPDAVADDQFAPIQVDQYGNLKTTGGSSYATRVDEPGGGITYVGIAVVGSLDAAAVWQIKKLTTTGTVLVITYANGNSNYVNIWDNRASLTFS